MPEDPCVKPLTINEVSEITGYDPASGCVHPLATQAGSIPVDDGTSVKMRTGATGDAIKLQSLQVLPGSFPSLVAQNMEGALVRKDADPSCLTKHIVSRDGSFELVDYVASTTYDQEICPALPDMAAGFITRLDCEGVAKLTLCQFPISSLGIEVPTLYFSSSQTVDVVGTGTSGDPYKFNVRVSDDVNNVLEVRADGLYSPGPLYLMPDPLDPL